MRATDARPRWLVLAFGTLLAAPALVFRWLPMTDLPQHWAAVRILFSLEDPQFGFASHYVTAWTSTLYLLPYALALGLAKLLPFAAAMRCVTFLSLLSYPLGVLALLRALRKPAWLGLLALPLVYNRAVFWGALQFNCVLGLALFACAQLATPRRSWRSEGLAAATVVAVVLTNPYGVMLVIGFAGLLGVLGDRRGLAQHWLSLGMLALGVAAWLWVGNGSFAPGTYYSEPLMKRLVHFGGEILGGYRGPSEDLLLLAWLALWLLFSVDTVPVTRRRWRALAPAARAVCVLPLVCAALYFVLPTHTAYAKAIHFRFALLAAAWLPLAAGPSVLARRPQLARAGLISLALATLALAWVQLARFDREASGFEAVLERLPERPNVLALTFDRNGRVMRTDPYLHFLAYAQARRGGLIAASFVGEFWQFPLRDAPGSDRPTSPPDFAWRPQDFDPNGFGAFYDWVIVRARHFGARESLPEASHELVLDAPPWRLYHARPRPPVAPESVEDGRLGKLSLFRATAPARALVFLFSDADGLTPDLVQTAGALAARGTTVVGVDLPQYLRGLAASDDGCHYLLSEIEDLSQRLQRELGYEGYRSPLLAGVGAGGTLAYAALAQSPAATVGGALAVDPAATLGTKVPLCPGAVSTPVAGHGFAYAPRADLPGRLRIATSGPPSEALRAITAASPGAELVDARGATPGARLAAGLAPLMTPGGAAPGAAALAALPLIEVPAKQPGELFAVIFSGDGGWRDLDKTVAEILARRGVPVVGVDSLRYFWRAKTPDQVARDLAAIIDAYRARWHTPEVILIGYSFGAGILPFAYNRLPAAERAAVVQLSLLGLEPTAPFEFHVSGWLHTAKDDGPAVLPELQRIDLALVQCVYGEQEDPTLCPARELEAAERIRTKGGHHFDGDYEALAQKILAGAERRLAAVRQGAQRAITPVTPPEISAATSVSTKGVASPPGAAR